MNLYVKSKNSLFTFHQVEAHKALDFHIGRDDLVQNCCEKEDLAMNGPIPWRGPREKARSFLQMIIEGTTLPGDIVMDCTASTGLFI